MGINFKAINDANATSLVPSFIKLYEQIEQIPDNEYKLGYVQKFDRIGYMVFPRFLKEHNYNDILEFKERIPQLASVVRLLHTEPYLQLPEFDGAYFKRFGVHKDCGKKFKPSTSINWPLINCNSSSVTSWYKLESGEPHETDVYIDADHCEVTQIESTSLIDGEPVLFRVDEWHAIDNYTPDKRVIAGWHFDEKYSWDDACEIMTNLGVI
jgi:hypothetical protein